MSFQNKTNKLMQDYVASIPFDQRLYCQDIEGSIAHAKMLAKQGIIAKSEAKKSGSCYGLREWTIW